MISRIHLEAQRASATHGPLVRCAVPCPTRALTFRILFPPPSSRSVKVNDHAERAIMESIGLTDRAAIAMSDPVTADNIDASGIEDEQEISDQMCPTQQATTADKTPSRSPANQSLRESTQASANIEKAATSETEAPKHLAAAHDGIRVGVDKTEAIAKDNRTVAAPSGYGTDERQPTQLTQIEPESDTITEELQETVDEEHSGRDEGKDASGVDTALGEDKQGQDQVNLAGAGRKM